MGVGAGLYMYDVVVKKVTFAISSPDEFLLHFAFHEHILNNLTVLCTNFFQTKLIIPTLISDHVVTLCH